MGREMRPGAGTARGAGSVLDRRAEPTVSAGVYPSPLGPWPGSVACLLRASRIRVAEREPEVALGRAGDGGRAVGVDHAAPPGTVNALEPVRGQPRQAAPDDLGPLRDQIRIAVHE